MQGQVTDLVLDGPQIHATVVGSRDAPYKVDVLFDEIDAAPFAQMIRDRPMLVARVLANDLPLEFEPFTKLSFKAHCTCPDWHHPCKHVAAVMFLVGEAVARKPELLLALRGLYVDDFVPPDEDPGEAASIVLPPKEDRASAAADPAIVVRRLGPIPFWRGQTRCVDALAKMYERIARAGAEDA